MAVEAALTAGVAHVLVTHPDYPTQGVPIAEQVELADRGAILERCFAPILSGKVSWEETFAAIRAAGPEKLVSARASDMNRSTATIRPTPGTQVGAVRGEAAAQRGQAGAGDAGRALGGDDHEDQQGQLLGPGQRRAHGVADEQRGHRQVHRGAVQVERVAGGHDDADDRLGHPRCSILAISRGSAVSEDEVATISRYSWRR